MARPVILTKVLTAASANNIALSQTPTSGTALTINGSTASSGVATLDTQRRVLLTFSNEASNRTMVITGTNAAGSVISETLSVAFGAGGTIATLQDFFTVTSALPLGGGWTAAVTIGTNTTGSTPWQRLNNHLTVFNVGFNLILTGTAGYQIDLTDESPQQTVPWDQIGGGSPTTPIPAAFNPTGFASLSASTNLDLTQPCLAWRLTIVSGTGSVKAEAVQSGIRD